VATATPAEPPRQERDESGKFKARQTAQPEPQEQQVAQQPDPGRPEKGQIAALLAERGKRQQAEQELAQMRARIAQLEAGDVLDPQVAVKDQVQRELAPLRANFFQQSVELAGKAHEDYEEVIEHFIEMVENNPAIKEQWLANENPGEFAYRLGSTSPKHQEKRDRMFKEQMTAKDAEINALRAKVADLEKSQSAVANLPESLNRQPSGSQPARQDDEYDINKIVRFK
jgi:hypothetical protein